MSQPFSWDAVYANGIYAGDGPREVEVSPLQAQPWPTALILPVSDLVWQFEVTAPTEVLLAQDYGEIMRQIFDLLLNFGPAAKESFPMLPDTSRLVGCMDLDLQSSQGQRLNQACQQLALGVTRVVDELGLWRRFYIDGRETMDCPYYFRGWVNKDVMLDHMPFSRAARENRLEKNPQAHRDNSMPF